MLRTSLVVTTEGNKASSAKFRSAMAVGKHLWCGRVRCRGGRHRGSVSHCRRRRPRVCGWRAPLSAQPPASAHMLSWRQNVDREHGAVSASRGKSAGCCLLLLDDECTADASRVVQLGTRFGELRVNVSLLRRPLDPVSVGKTPVSVPHLAHGGNHAARHDALPLDQVQHCVAAPREPNVIVLRRRIRNVRIRSCGLRCWRPARRGVRRKPGVAGDLRWSDVGHAHAPPPQLPRQRRDGRRRRRGLGGGKRHRVWTRPWWLFCCWRA